MTLPRTGERNYRVLARSTTSREPRRGDGGGYTKVTSSRVIALPPPAPSSDLFVFEALSHWRSVDSGWRALCFASANHPRQGVSLLLRHRGEFTIALWTRQRRPVVTEAAESPGTSESEPNPVAFRDKEGNRRTKRLPFLSPQWRDSSHQGFGSRSTPTTRGCEFAAGSRRRRFSSLARP